MELDNREDMVKNLFKATRFNLYSHEWTLRVQYFSYKGWLAKLKDFKESLEKLFHHIFSVSKRNIWAR
jgi:hypothetical protein